MRGVAVSAACVACAVALSSLQAAGGEPKTSSRVAVESQCRVNPKPWPSQFCRRQGRAAGRLSQEGSVAPRQRGLSPSEARARRPRGGRAAAAGGGERRGRWGMAARGGRGGAARRGSASEFPCPFGASPGGGRRVLRRPALRSWPSSRPQRASPRSQAAPFATNTLV